ncbi:MAG TPA: hypothetical protein VKZ63_07590 [Kofleriaceae bacterium]|nr:hypothetical protein [Kofleriaceae bacterium]
MSGADRASGADPRSARGRAGAGALAAALALAPACLALGAGCGGGKVRPAPPPLRPEARAVADSSSEPRTDCEPISPSAGPAPLSYEERSISEAENLASQGFELLKRAGGRDAAEIDRQRLLEQAVHRFVTALLADPYNVHATYNLAAAYARIGRAQCAVNLLARLVPLRKLPSQKDQVEEKLDRLFGRGKYKGRLDPDFFDLRDDPRFRELARNF